MHVALAGPIAGDDVQAYLHPAAGPAPAGYAGAPLTGILIGELLRLGHRVTGITTDSTLPLNGGPVTREGPNFTFVACPARPRAWRFNGRHPGRALDFFAFERRGISRAMAASAADIIHAHWSYEFALAALAQPAPHLITCHDSPAVVLRFSQSPYRALRYLMARRVFQRGRQFTTVSEYMARELAPELAQMPQVVPNPVSAQVLAMGRKRTASSSRRVAMVCNGWDRRKNPEPGIRSFALWRSTEPSAELHLFGADFGAGEMAHRWAESQGLAQGIAFHGRLSHRELMERLEKMDALLLTSLEESFGVVLAEGMALGLPLVAGRSSGAVPSVVGADASGNSDCAVLTDVQSDTALAWALTAVFDQNYSARSAAGIKRAAQLFTPNSVTRAYVEEYERILSETPRLN